VVLRVPGPGGAERADLGGGEVGIADGRSHKRHSRPLAGRWPAGRRGLSATGSAIAVGSLRKFRSCTPGACTHPSQAGHKVAVVRLGSR
jgi:hypothetical protein